MLEGKEIKFNGVEATVVPRDARIDDYEPYVESVALEGDYAMEITLSEKVSWDDEEQLQKEIQQAIAGDAKWPDTKDSSWTEHRLMEEDTQLHDVVGYVASNPYCTSGRIDEVLDITGEISNVIYKAKKRNLIATVSKQSQYHVLAPTHLAFKELYITAENDDEFDIQFLTQKQNKTITNSSETTR